MTTFTGIFCPGKFCLITYEYAQLIIDTIQQLVRSCQGGCEQYFDPAVYNLFSLYSNNCCVYYYKYFEMQPFLGFGVKEQTALSIYSSY